MTQRPGYLPILFLTLGWFGIQMAMALDATQFQVILDEQVGNAAMIGAVLSLGPIAGITVQPLVGLLGDKMAGRGLSRKGLMWIALGVALISTLALSVPSGFLPTVGLIALFFIAYNILIVTYRAIVTETSSRKSLMGHKGLISGCTALFSGIGAFSMFALCSVLGGTPYPFWIGSAVLLVTLLLFFRFAPSGKTVANAEPKNSGESLALFQGANLLFYAFPFAGAYLGFERFVCRGALRPEIFRLFLVVFFAWFGIQALRGFFVLFAVKSLLMTQSQGNILLAILTLAMILAAIPLGKLADRFDGAVLFKWSLLFFALVSLVAYYLVGSFLSAAVMSVLLGVSFAGMVIFPLSLLLKLCPPGKEGVYAGLYNLFISVPQLYSLLLTGNLVEVMHDYRVILLVAFGAVMVGFWMSFRLKAPIEVTSEDLSRNNPGDTDPVSP